MHEEIRNALKEIRRLCEEGTQAHGDEFYGPILEQAEKIEKARWTDTYI
jgi:hypothetical protein